MRANIIYYIIILITMLGAPISILAETKNNDKSKYPPYPDVWGYDISEVTTRDNKSSFSSVYKALNGDIVFEVLDKRYNEKGLIKNKYLILKFFEGKTEEVDNIKTYIKENNLERIYEISKIILKNGQHIESYYSTGGTLCQNNELLQNLLLKGQVKEGRDRLSIHDEDVEKVSIIAARPNISRSIDKEDGYCDRGGPGGGELIYEQLYFLPMGMIKLDDDTFITVSNHLAIRFDSNFKTKFKPKHDVCLSTTNDWCIKGNFFVIPYSIIEELDMKTTKDNDHGVQGLHDRILLYLYKQQGEEKK
ncbi:hypothetical protein H1Q59_03110 [Holosporaceae bacterium 'Namur']|nr:hypothetical protein [Holosporaceae bacterium 'Namur']